MDHRVGAHCRTTRYGMAKDFITNQVIWNLISMSSEFVLLYFDTITILTPRRVTAKQDELCRFIRRVAVACNCMLRDVRAILCQGIMITKSVQIKL